MMSVKRLSQPAHARLCTNTLATASNISMRLSCGSLDRIAQFNTRLEAKLSLSALQPALPALDLMWIRSLPAVSSKYPGELESLVLPRLTARLETLLASQVEALARFLAKARLMEEDSHPVLTFIQDCPYLLPLSAVESLKKILEHQAGQALPTMLYRCFQQEFDLTSSSKHFAAHFGQLGTDLRLRSNKVENSLSIRSLQRKLMVKVLGVTHNQVAALDSVLSKSEEDWAHIAVDFPEDLQDWSGVFKLKEYFRLKEPAGLIQRQEFGLARIDPMLSIAHQQVSKGQTVVLAAPSYDSQLQTLSSLLEKDISYTHFCSACHYEIAHFLNTVSSKGCNYCSSNKEVPLARSQLSTQLFPAFRDWYYWQVSAKLHACAEQGGRVLACVHAPMHFEVVKRLLHFLQGGTMPQFSFQPSTAHMPAAEAMLDECLAALFKPGVRKEPGRLRALQQPSALQEWKHSKYDKSCLAVAQLRKVS